MNTRLWRNFVLPLVAGFVFIWAIGLGIASRLDWTSSSSAPKPRRPAQNFPPPDPTTTSTATAKLSQGNTKGKSPVQRFVEEQSARVGKTDLYPKLTFQRLQNVARGLGRKDMQDLAQNAVNRSLGNDQRFTSVYLLSLSENRLAQDTLFHVATTPMPPDVTPESRAYAEELMIRTQALEGLARFHTRGVADSGLVQVIRQQGNSFLADQARRLLREREATR